MALTDEDRQVRLERLQALGTRRARLEQLLATAVREQNPGEQYALPSHRAELPLQAVATLRAQRSGFANFKPQQAAIAPQQEFRPIDLGDIRAQLDEELPRPAPAPALQTQEPEAPETPETVAEAEVSTETEEASGVEDASDASAGATDSAPEPVEASEDEDLAIPVE